MNNINYAAHTGALVAMGTAGLALAAISGGALVAITVHDMPAAPVVVEEQGTPPADIQQAPAAPLKADDFMGAVALCDYYYVADTAAWTDCVLAADTAFPVEDIDTLDS